MKPDHFVVRTPVLHHGKVEQFGWAFVAPGVGAIESQVSWPAFGAGIAAEGMRIARRGVDVGAAIAHSPLCPTLLDGEFAL